MNPEIRGYMYHHYETGYMPYPVYGTHMAYGYPSYYTHYHPHHMAHHFGSPSGPMFAVPMGAPVRYWSKRSRTA
ncbi:hypothetical protein [Bacillus sp. EB600]|uniref:hypothetical protein n=1 Tax=Bacillus sp. EB600 TaxID=2806345 RepID=UPI00210D6C3B|nr:hypothetical protein [Bacillus sp. EB600]MCQ6282934.1 hypothetical protein [Bacillus sp. EB600]